MDNNKENKHHESIDETVDEKNGKTSNDECTSSEETTQKSADLDENNDSVDWEIAEKIESLECELAQWKDKHLRLAAEFDNYKKRTQKEKEAIYNDSVCDVVLHFLPVMDNMERAVSVLEKTASENKHMDASVLEGVKMVTKQFVNAFQLLGVEKIQACDCAFDPNLHDAVTHIEDDQYDENTVVEELQTGYKYKDRVIRHSMVKVAN